MRPRSRVTNVQKHILSSVRAAHVVVAMLATALLVERANALPSTTFFSDSVTHSFYGSAGFGGDGATISTDCISLPPPGLIGSVTIEVSFSSRISVTNSDPFGFAENNTFINWTPWILVVMPDGSSTTLYGDSQQVVKVGAGEVSACGDFSDTLLLSFGGTGLAGPDPLRVHMTTEVSTGTSFGFGQHEASFHAAVIYSAVDAASTGWLVAPAVLLLLWRARRARRRDHAGAPA